MRVHFIKKSKNQKVGPVPVSITSSRSCPDACPLRDNGCYAVNGPMRWHWERLDAGQTGSDWETFCAQVRDLPEGQFWRHNTAGDLPGTGDLIDAAALRALVCANKGKRGFTFTHKPARGRNLTAIKAANKAGFTINLSADTLAEADQLASLQAGPVAVILPHEPGKRHDLLTPAGRPVATCPATYREDTTCETCQLCQRQNRKVIVGFPAHGPGRKKALQATLDKV